MGKKKSPVDYVIRKIRNGVHALYVEGPGYGSSWLSDSLTAEDAEKEREKAKKEKRRK